MAQQYTREQFAARIKEKYPAYAEMDDNALVDKILTKYPQYGEQIIEGKDTGLQAEDAIAAPEDGASTLVEDSSELDAKAKAIQVVQQNLPGIAGAVANTPVMADIANRFASTLIGFAGGTADFAAQQAARFDEDFQKQMADATPSERQELWESYSDIGDTISDVAEASGATIAKHGTGSIVTDIANGDYTSAAYNTIDQTTAGLASLVPFLIPGGMVLGPAILGSATGADAFREGLKHEDATMEQIYNASYAQAGNEFAWELVTAGIIGRARKMAAGGASAAAVKEFTKKAWKRVAGDSAKEAFAEGITDTGSKIVDKIIYGDEIDTKEAVVGFLDSAIVGGIVGGKVATFGELSAPGSVHEKVAAQSLRTEDQQNESAERAKTVEEAQKIINDLQTKDIEGSLVDQATLEAAEAAKAEAIAEEKAAQDSHVETLRDMTKPELEKYAKGLDKAKKLKAEKKEIEANDAVQAELVPNYTYTDTSVLDEQIAKEEAKANEVYTVVANWADTTAAVDQTVKNNEEKIKELEVEEKKIDLEEKSAKAAEQPNPVGTLTRKEKRKKIAKDKKVAEKNIEQLQKVKDAARPDHADAKSRARKKKVTPADTKVGKKKQANEDIFTTLKDAAVPQTQKDKALTDFYKKNAGLITNLAKAISGKTLSLIHI